MWVATYTLFIVKMRNNEYSSVLVLLLYFKLIVLHYAVPTNTSSLMNI